MYAEGLPAEVRLKALTTGRRLPFVFEASGSETHFTNGYDPNPRARRIFAFPKPATLARTLRDVTADLERPTWRGKVAAMPVLDEVQTSEQRLQSLRRSLLAAAFSGRLTGRSGDIEGVEELATVGVL